jgi:segregation and condensation protein B
VNDNDDVAAPAEAEPPALEDVERAVEALLFAAAGPLSVQDLARRLPEGADVAAAIAALKARYDRRGVELAEVAGRWRFQTAADLAWLMTEERLEPRRLSKAAQEILAIIAYHQPVTRAEMEQIRGVQTSRGSLDVLLELGLVRMRGRRRSPGRPVTYGTTDAFLEHYGLASLADLPGMAEMRAAGLLDLNMPSDFALPDPSRTDEDEEPLAEGEVPEFHQDFLGDEE